MNREPKLGEEVIVDYRCDESQGIVKGYGVLMNEYNQLQVCYIIFLFAENKSIIVTDPSTINFKTS